MSSFEHQTGASGSRRVTAQGPLNCADMFRNNPLMRTLKPREARACQGMHVQWCYAVAAGEREEGGKAFREPRVASRRYQNESAKATLR